MDGSHLTLTAIFACAAIHVGFVALGLEPVFEAMGEGVREIFTPEA